MKDEKQIEIKQQKVGNSRLNRTKKCRKNKEKKYFKKMSGNGRKIRRNVCYYFYN